MEDCEVTLGNAKVRGHNGRDVDETLTSACSRARAFACGRPQFSGDASILHSNTAALSGRSYPCRRCKYLHRNDATTDTYVEGPGHPDSHSTYLPQGRYL